MCTHFCTYSDTLIVESPTTGRCWRTCLFLSQLVLVQEGAVASAGGLLRGGETCQGNDLDRLLLLTAAVSVQGVVELWPIDLVQFVLPGHGSAQGVATIHEPQAGFGSLGETRLETKCGHRTGDGGGDGGRCWAVATGTLELRQGWGHPAAVRVAQYQALLGAGLRGFSQSFLHVHFDSCKNKTKKKTWELIRTFFLCQMWKKSTEPTHDS